MTASDLSDYQPTQYDGREETGIKGTTRKLKDGARSVLHDRIEPMVDQTKAYADHARTKIDGAVRTVTDKAMEKPATSALAILGVGILIGAALAITLRRPASSLGDSLRDYSGGLGESLRDRTHDLKGRAHDWTDQLRSLLHR